MPPEFFPKDDCSLQEHQGPHSPVPDVGRGDDEADDEVGLDRIERFRVKKTMIVKRLSVLGTDNVNDDCYSPGLLWNS